MYDSFISFLTGKQKICVIQAENPDGDSLGSALALAYLLEDKTVSLYCPVDIPKYLHYMKDWSLVEIDFDFDVDGYIIVDTAADILLSKLLEVPEIKRTLNEKPVFVLDHHETADDLSFPHESIIEDLPACCDLIYKIAKDQNLTIGKTAAEYLLYGILSDTLGFTSESTTADTLRTAAELVELGANLAELEEARREFAKKSRRILDYKSDLIKKVEYFYDGELATVHIPWEEIREYSDEYNPNVLILEELRLVQGVKVAVAIKTYPDGRMTGKIRTTFPIADQVAGYFGGGGHAYAAGFRTYDLTYDDAVRELNAAYAKLKDENEAL